MGIKSLKWAFRPKEFTNSKTEKDGINYSRYIASWCNAGGGLRTYDEYINFMNWLETLNLTEEEILSIARMATCGKIELEDSAGEFILKG